MRSDSFVVAAELQKSDHQFIHWLVVFLTVFSFFSHLEYRTAAPVQTRGSIISEILSLVMPPAIARHMGKAVITVVAVALLLVTLNFSSIVIGQFWRKKKLKFIFLKLESSPLMINKTENDVRPTAIKSKIALEFTVVEFSAKNQKYLNRFCVLNKTPPNGEKRKKSHF